MYILEDIVAVPATPLCQAFPAPSRDTSPAQRFVLVDSLNPIVLSDHESDSGDTTVSGDLHTAPQVCGPALEGVLDPNQD